MARPVLTERAGTGALVVAAAVMVARLLREGDEAQESEEAAATMIGVITQGHARSRWP